MLRGQTILALWNGVDPARRDEYEVWHTREHVPERLTVPGMIGAKRYVRTAGDLPYYFTLYEMRDAEVLSSAPYRELLTNPTEWSRSMRPSFTDFLRVCCQNVVSLGGGVGGYAAAVLFDNADNVSPTEISGVFSGLLNSEMVTGAHLLCRDYAIADVPFEIAQASADIPRSGIVLIEGFDRVAMERVLQRAMQDLTRIGAGVHAPSATLYQLSYVLDADCLADTHTIDHTSGAKITAQNQET